MQEFAFTQPGVCHENMAVYDARKAPFRIYGLYKPEQAGTFRRMPKAVAEATSKRVTLLHENTAGARLRFATDSSYISVGAIMPPMEFASARTAVFAGANMALFDLYADGEHCRVLWPEKVTQRGSVVSFDLDDGRYEAGITFSQKKIREITLCFPSFVNISHVFIGLEKDCVLTPARDYRNEKPVVFYGSSITQGACACRAGNTYQNILSRKLNFDYLNLGFAGACRAEPAVIDYICTLDTPLLVFDYDHNAKSAEYLQETHLPALRKLRAAHPDIPIVVMSRPDQDTGEADTIRRARLIEENCRILRQESAAPVHFVNGMEIFHSHDKDMMTIDGTHPTDLGFYCMAQALYKVLEQYFP